MTKSKYKITILLCCFLLSGLNNYAGSIGFFPVELTKEINEVFMVNPGATLKVDNRFGDINISTWNKNEIAIDVVINVKSGDKEKAREFLDDIVIEFEHSRSNVSAETVFPDNDNNGSWWSIFWGSSKSLDYEVNYSIKVPTEVNTNITNKYGSISSTSIDGFANVENKYGDIHYNDITGDLDLSLGYGKASFGSMNNANIEIKYSTLILENTSDINIESKYSKITANRTGRIVAETKYDSYKIEDAERIVNEGKYDSWTIGSIGSFDIDTKYTGVRIEMLYDAANFNCKNGSAKIEGLGDNVEKIHIDSKYTDFTINLDQKDFFLEFDGSYTDLDVSKPYDDFREEKDGSDNHTEIFRGRRDARLIINAVMDYGGLNLK